MPTELMLRAREQKRLDKCEERIAKGMIGAFYEVGKALDEINENGLYQHCGTFAAYVSERWGMQASHAYKLIRAAGVMERLQCVQLDTLPTQESQVRHLSKIEPDDLPEVWKKVIEKATKTEDKKPVITESLVKQVVDWWLTPDDEPIDTTAEEVETDDEDEPEEDEEPEGTSPSPPKTTPSYCSAFRKAWEAAGPAGQDGLRMGFEIGLAANATGRAAITAFLLDN